MTPSPAHSNRLRRFLGSIGPAFIVACVVLGPGSILTSSKVGCQFGYSLAWVLFAAGLLMVAAVATAARVGASLQKTPCQAIADRFGRPAGLVLGMTVFLITACFQFSNNLGVLAALEPLIDVDETTRIALLLLLNVGAAATLFGLGRLYKPIEKLMMAMVGLMLIGFAANLAFARPSVGDALSGIVPRMPEQLTGQFFPRVEPATDAAKARFIDPWLTVQALVATTFSAAGAFYQAYLAKEKGWTAGEVKRGFVDSLAGTAVLVTLTWMIMSTSAAVLYGVIEPSELKSAANVATQLEPLFGAAAKWLFCMGIFAGALSSFVVNSMIGGTMLADGLGFDARMDSAWTKRFTVLVLLVGMVVTLTTSSAARVPLIILAHAVTVLGNPILILSLIFLACRRVDDGRRVAPAWMIGLLSVGAVVVVALAARTAVRLWLQMTTGAS